MKYFAKSLLFAAFLLQFTAASLSAEEAPQSQKLAKQLQNPVASLISVPFQNNFETGLGAGNNGSRYLLRVQPVVPLSLNKDWNLIVRPIVPYISQQNVTGAASQKGLGDTEVELFFSPKEFKKGEPIWGIGAVILLPTASEAAIGTQKWGLGPNFCVLKEDGPWTAGLLANQVWSFAGDMSRSDINLTYLQPFVSHSNKTGFTCSVQSETSYDWIAKAWTIPLEAGISQIIPLFGHYTSLGLTGIYNLESPSNISKWSTRVAITLIFPE